MSTGTSTVESKVTADATRDGKGRYLTGVRGGPGNPYNRAVAAIKRELMMAYEEGDVAAIRRKLIEMAKDGNLGAKLLFQYTMPRDVDPDREDVAEWQLVKEDAQMRAEVRRTYGPPPAEVEARRREAARQAEIVRAAAEHAAARMTPAEIDALAASVMGADGKARRVGGVRSHESGARTPEESAGPSPGS